MKPIVFTVGHSTKPIEEFTPLIKGKGVNILIDVRTIPFSKYNPQYNRYDLEKSLNRVGVAYVYKGKNLGGKGINIAYEENIREVKVMAQNGVVCVMCSESDPSKCHRTSRLRPSLEAEGCEVVDILWANTKGSKIKEAIVNIAKQIKLF